LLVLTAFAMLIGAIAADVGPQVLLTGWGMSLLTLFLVRLWTPALVSHEASRTLTTWSLRMPMLGLALVMPVTLHAMTMMCIGEMSTNDFSSWIWMSTLGAAQAYVALCWLTYKDAERIATNTAAEPWKKRAWAALWKTTAASCIPGIVLLGIPPILTFLTGAAFIPAMYFLAHRINDWERACTEWLSLASRLGLDAAQPRLFSLPKLTGIVDGVRIEASGSRTATGSMVFELEAALLNPALLHLSISADPRDSAQIRIGDPVTDAVLRVSSTSSTSASALDDLLRNDECYAALMAVVHGLGGRISRGRIHLRIQTSSIASLWDALPLVIDLARLMRQPSARVSPAVLSPPSPLRRASPAG
jgi:hypothetical protein